MRIVTFVFVAKSNLLPEQDIDCVRLLNIPMILATLNEPNRYDSWLSCTYWLDEVYDFNLNGQMTKKLCTQISSSPLRLKTICGKLLPKPRIKQLSACRDNWANNGFILDSFKLKTV